MIKIIEPKAELLEYTDLDEHVARCAAICYNSKPKKGKEAIAFVNALSRNNHTSVLRHATMYFMIPCSVELTHFIEEFSESPYVQYCVDNNNYYIVTNGQWIYEHTPEYELLKPYEVNDAQFKASELASQLIRYTFCLTTQISTSRELNRVSPNNITEQSTRYVRMDEVQIIRPFWMTAQEADRINNDAAYYCEMSYDYNKDDYNEKRDAAIGIYIDSIIRGYDDYQLLLYRGFNKDNARGVLSLDTITKVIYTYSVNEWRNIINLRYYGTTGKPHGNAQLIIGLVKNELEKLGYEFRDPKLQCGSK